jgi:two-component system sensor histidine kinase DesK
MRLPFLPETHEDGWTPYVWLVYLALYVFYAVEDGTRDWRWLAHAAALAVFLALYFRGFWVDGARRLPIIVALMVLGIVMVPLNPGAATFFIYAAAFVGGARAGRAAAIWIGAIAIIGTTVTAFATPASAGAALMTLVFVPLIGGVNVHYYETRRRDASLKIAREDVARLAALGERERIARDLHDLLGHTLSVIVLKSELAAKLLPAEPDRAAREVADIERISRESLHEVRRAVQGFRTASFDDEVVRARGVLQTAGIAVEGALAASDSTATPGLPPRIELALAFVLREAVTNVVRHARATRCRLSLARDGPVVRLEVEDDGVGGEAVDGSGLHGMRDRLREVGGTLERDGRRGTVVRASVPER